MLTLTRRESEVLAAVAEGLSNADIAARLGNTERTVKNILSGVSRAILSDPDDRGGSSRVRLALWFHKVGPYAGRPD
jgi:DNA-binding NarL/FixJ family response regulator